MNKSECQRILRKAVSIETADEIGLIGKWIKIKRHWYQVIWRHDGKLSIRFNQEAK